MSNLPAPIIEALKDKSVASRFTAGRYDKALKWSAERQFAEQAITKNPELLKCSMASIQQALLDVAYSGLSLSPSMAHGYLIPYGEQCSFAPGYRGLLHLAFKAGTVKSVQVNLVYDGDPEFHVWTDETGRHIKHVENQRGKRGEVSHAYCLANLTAGGPPIIEVMNREQLKAVEAAASARNRKGGMVWRSAFREEMCKKAVLRRASKFWPKDSGGLIEHMMSVSDKFDGIDFNDIEQDRDPPEQELCISLDQQTMLQDTLIEHGIPPDAAPTWLSHYAKAKGYSSADNLPARLFDEAKAFLIERAKKAASSAAH